MNEPTPPRDSRRVPLELRVQIKYDRFSGFISEMSANLSPGGMFIRSERPEPVGSLLDFELRLGDGFELLRGRGLVAWVRANDDGEGRPPGMGIRFLGLTQQGRELIEKVVRQHVSRGGTPFDLTKVGAQIPQATPSGPAFPGPTPRVIETAPPEPMEMSLDATLPISTARTLFPELAAETPLPTPASAPPIRSAESAMSLFPDEPSKSTSKRVEVFEAPEPPPLFEARPSPLAAEPAEEPVVRPAAEPIRRPTSIPMAEREVERPRAAPPQGLGETFSESFSNREADFAASGILDPAKEVARGPAPYFAGQPAPPPRRLLPRFSLVLALVLGLSAFAGWWLRDLWWDLVFDSVGAEPLPAAFAQPERSPTRRPLSSTPAETTASSPSPTATGGSALPNAADAANAANAASPASPAAVESAAPTASATPLPSLNLLERIDVVPQAGETVVTLVADGIVRSSNYARFRIDSGSPRELVKMRGVRRPFHSASIAVGSPELVKIRTGFHAPEELHIVFDLASPDIEVLAIEESAASLRLRFGRRAR